MQSDPWWSLAMAINVFLVFYFPATPDSFQRWWWLYCLICYGGPFAIALSLLLVRRGYKELIYGEATVRFWQYVFSHLFLPVLVICGLHPPPPWPVLG